MGRHELKNLRRILRDLVQAGRAERFEGRYRVPRPDGVIAGVFHTRGRNLRQVLDDEGRVWEVAPGAASGGAADGDRVLLQPPADGRGSVVVQVSTSTRSDWIGVLDRDGLGGFVTPYRDEASWGIRIPRSGFAGAEDGDVVVVRLERRQRTQPEGRVVEVLGPPGTPEADFRAVVWHRRLRVAFPDAVLAEAEAIPGSLDPEECRRRVDLRERPFLTIDPATARDHDDAVCVEAARGGAIRLWVAIADVSHYVAEGGALDAEALLRGNSVYFPDRAIPMLPERLSSTLCSLRPDEDRLAMCAELLVERSGEVSRRSFYPAVIRSCARLAYPEAAAQMDADADAEPQPPRVVDQLRGLAEVAGRLQERRLAAGSIDFDLPGADIVLGDDGQPVDIVREPRTTSHRAIEEAMLVANREVSRALRDARVPALYRVHEPPSLRDMEELCGLLQGFGLLERRVESLTPRDVARALQRAAGRPEERLINLVTLRCMRQARYGDRDTGHFALAFDSYTHFTSPIRRYADLVVHRALKDLLAGDPPALRRAEGRGGALASIAAQISFRERVAEAAEREMVDLKKCAFMAPHVGETFEGAISGVARHGFYVTLDRFFVDGLVHVSRLPGYAVFDPGAHALVMRGSRERFRLGDRVRVVLDGVDRVKAWINLSLADRPPEPARPRAGRSGRKGRRRR